MTRESAVGVAAALCLLNAAIICMANPAVANPVLHLRATEYYTALETDYPAGHSAAFVALNGSVLYRGSRAFHDAATTEGSARIRDGAVINLTGDGTTRWRYTSATYGLATNDCPLVPFRSVAIDPAIVPLGSRIRIAETVGMPLPGGGTHDGIWLATDAGPQIAGDRIDLFVGAGLASLETLQRFGIRNLQPLTVEILGPGPSCADTAK